MSCNQIVNTDSSTPMDRNRNHSPNVRTSQVGSAASARRQATSCLVTDREQPLTQVISYLRLELERGVIYRTAPRATKIPSRLNISRGGKTTLTGSYIAPGFPPDSEPDVNAGRAENLSLSLLLRWGFYCGDLKFTQLKRER